MPTKWPTMPFGKHKGRDVRDVPTDYLQWVLRTVPRERLSAPLRAAIIVVVTDRLSPAAARAAGKVTNAEAADGLAAEWYARMLRRWPMNRRLDGLNLAAALSDGCEQLGRMLNEMLGDDVGE